MDETSEEAWMLNLLTSISEGGMQLSHHAEAAQSSLSIVNYLEDSSVPLEDMLDCSNAEEEQVVLEVHGIAEQYYNRMRLAPLTVPQLEQQNSSTNVFFTRITFIETEVRSIPVHSGLLCRESERFRKCLTGNFIEAENMHIELFEENNLQVEQFIQWLYRENLEANFEANSEASIGTQLGRFAELYAMGERFLARRFQGYIMNRFIELGPFERPGQFKQYHICRLLRTACTKITQRTNGDDSMRVAIFELAAFHLSSLKRSAEFRALLSEHDGLAEETLFRSGNGSYTTMNTSFLHEDASIPARPPFVKRRIKVEPED